MASLKTALPRALAVVERVMREGQRAHPKDEWIEQGIQGNLIHLSAHLDLYQKMGRDVDLDHAACRLLMAVELRERGRK